MTEKLRALLDERASAPAFDLPDLDAVRSAGLRRRRRAYAGVTAGGVVATAAATALVLGLVTGGDGPEDAVPVAVDPPTTARLDVSWALGSVIHTGDEQVDVGHQVRVYARTSLGYVTVDDRDRVWSVVDGAVEQLGTVATDNRQLLSDTGSARVAWLGTDGDLVVHDLTAGSQTSVALPGAGTDPVELLATDAALAYLRVGTQLVEVDLGNGEQRVVRSADQDLADFDAASGLTVATVYGSAGAVAEVGPAAGPPTSTFRLVDGGSPLLSSGATYLAVGGDDGPVHDTATGQEKPLDLRGFYEPYEWWDDTTLAVITETSPGSERARLSSCDVVTGTCRTEVADLGPFDRLEGFSLPVGER